MYLTIKIDENLNVYQVKDIKQKIGNVISEEGYNYQIFDFIDKAFIQNEIEYRNENKEDFRLLRTLTKSEITELTDKILTYDELFTDVTEVIDDEINKLINHEDNQLENTLPMPDFYNFNSSLTL